MIDLLKPINKQTDAIMIQRYGRVLIDMYNQTKCYEFAVNMIDSVTRCSQQNPLLIVIHIVS